ncbi:biosynthetic-type acetolactate synthase large subunit [Roseivirga sp. UBA1976]|uniref:biosynthetic-type acetolactate synthase large subunit n=1 Tax=Roseivirga sp. UBA1976 TaxID=1947386 RepID=UPI00257E1150|nr:biosynthetic-type acetolactate synthase large subunit [Roseivirga sp. UBA1976]MEC7755818.1 biosynthetic-type acetolactate synthase large subunit [Bacteroidota bacterium]
MEATIAQSVSEKVKTSGAEAVIRSLLAEKVDLLFGYPGGAIMPVYDALFHYQQALKHVLTRHEQGAIHAAQGYARATGKVGVVMATSGPGATNLITGIADAMIDSTPLVCITGQVGSHLLGTDAFQETDIISISMPCTKWNFQVTKAEEIPAALAKAFYIAQSGRPGPVLIDITKDAQFGEVEFEYRPCQNVRSYKPVPPINPEAIEQAAELINSAKRPFVLFGQGVILGQAEEEFKSFIEKTGIPAASTLLGLSALPTDHPLNVGMLGMHGNYGPNKLTNECDVLIAIGMRFDDRVTGDLSRYAVQAKVIHLDIDPSEINKNVKVQVPVLGNCKETLKHLTQAVKRKSHQAWLEQFRAYGQIEHEQVIEPELKPLGPELTMGEVIRQVNELARGEAILVTDVGQHQMVACRYTHFKQTKSNITSGGLGTMGFCLPAALGAKLGTPDREVVAVIGDGGFQMTLQELGTIFQTKAAVKIIILNNSFLGMVRQWQQLFFDKRYSSTEMVNPDFVKIAEGYGIKGRSIKQRSQLKEAVAEMLNHKESYLLEVHVGKEDNVFPMVPTGASVSDVRLS